MKKYLLAMLLMMNANAGTSECSYAKSMAERYMTQSNNYNLKSVASACKMADSLEQAVNWMGTMQQQCQGFQSSYGSVFELNKNMLMVASQKCGH